MIEAVLVTILPVGFLIIIFLGGALFLKKKISQDGEAPINRTLFYASKWSIMILWGAMALASWGIGFSPVQVPRLLQLIALAFWCAGFALLYLGRFKMGDSFRLGTPKEDTSLKTDGLFRLSRNPMYVGVYATIVAASLYTLNPVCYPAGGVCGCRPPCNRPGRRENHAHGIQPGIFGVLQPRTAIRLTKKAQEKSQGEVWRLTTIHIFYEPVRSSGSPGQSPVFPLYRSHKKRYTFGKCGGGR